MKHLYILTVAVLFFSSCADFVEPGAPKTQIIRAEVFRNDVGAQAAISGIYSQMMTGSSFASGSINGMTAIGGLSADELVNYSSSQNQIGLFTNRVTPQNTAISSNWNDMYLYIYESNSILEGLSASNQITDTLKQQIRGEALFIRAFCHFYLTNLFGEVPLITGTDYRINKSAQRASVDELYSQIETDLTNSIELLSEDYSFSFDEKVQPNKWAAEALLARASLYQRKWGNAETHATAVINSGVANLSSDLEQVFIANSEEAIWQLMPSLPGYNTSEAPYMIITGNPTNVALSDNVLTAFEGGDARADAWIGSIIRAGKSYKYAFKYKIRLRNLPVTEYYTVFRLAEQYLIRAEARVELNKLSEAVEDINIIRTRAGLEPLDDSGMSKENVIAAIRKERQIELFAEWGHRWFDLKRWGIADGVLGPVKADWQSTDVFFPIPQTEITLNPNLTNN